MRIQLYYNFRIKDKKLKFLSVQQKEIGMEYGEFKKTDKQVKFTW